MQNLVDQVITAQVDLLVQYIFLVYSLKSDVLVDSVFHERFLFRFSLCEPDLSDVCNQVLLFDVDMLIDLHQSCFFLFLDEDSGQEKSVLAPVVIDQLVEQDCVLHELVQLRLAIELVVILGEEVLDGVIVDLLLVVLNNAEQAVGHQDLVGPQEVLRLLRLHEFVADADSTHHFLRQAHSIVV